MDSTSIDGDGTATTVVASANTSTATFIGKGTSIFAANGSDGTTVNNYRTIIALGISTNGRSKNTGIGFQCSGTASFYDKRAILINTDGGTSLRTFQNIRAKDLQPYSCSIGNREDWEELSEVEKLENNGALT